MLPGAPEEEEEDSREHDLEVTGQWNSKLVACRLQKNDRFGARRGKFTGTSRLRDCLAGTVRARDYTKRIGG